MLRELPFWQFLEWEEFDRVEPLGGQRGDWQAASMCAATMNAMERLLAALSRRSRVTKVWTAKDFLLEFKPETATKKEGRKVSTALQEMKMKARFIADLQNAEVESDARRNRNRKAVR